MPALEVIDAAKSFGVVPALRGVSLTVESGELVCLLGPSGCGKSTLLRLIAGLETPDVGSVTFAGVNQVTIVPHLREFGLMFQDLALFPHMDVARNVAFGLKMHRQSSEMIEKRVAWLLRLVGLGGYGSRKIHELSGGERQRVALARSLAPAPKLLMLDEPLGSLDRVLRESLQGQLRSILKEIGVAAIYVTHDKDEAFAIADKIVFMDQGLVVQTGSPEALFREPTNDLVARTLGMKNILPGTLEQATGPMRVSCALGTLAASGPIPEGVIGGSDVQVLIDERGVTVSPAQGGRVHEGAVPGVVLGRAFKGGESEVRVRIGRGELTCTVALRDAGANVEVSDDVTVLIPAKAVRLFSQGG